MSAFWRRHPIFKWTAVSVIGLFTAIVIAASLADWNALRRPIARVVSAETGHATSIDGNLSVRLWSWNPTGLLLPDADLQVNRVRGMDTDVTFKSQSVISSKIPLRHVQFHLLLENGVLRLDPCRSTLPHGQLAGRVQIDASKNVPQSDIEMHLESLDLAQ